MAYDDEGYVLISLKNYSEHGGLYREVFSQYGPFFYVFHDLLHRIFGYDFTNAMGRLFNLGCWLISIGLPTHVVWRTTRSVALSFVTLASLFCYLNLMANEPVHPGGMITALLAFMGWLGFILIGQKKIGLLMIASGAVGAALMLTKINVGIFFILASVAWFATQLGHSRLAQAGTIVAGIAMMILPLTLMRAHLDRDWAQLFVALSIISSVTTLTNIWLHRKSDLDGTLLIPGIAGFCLTCAVTVMLVTKHGTSCHEILEGVLIGPLRHPNVYYYQPFWNPGAAAAAAISLAWFGIACKHQDRKWFGWITCGLRLLIVVVFTTASAGWLPFSSHMFVMSFGVTSVWIHGVRLGPGPQHDREIGWISLLLVLQFLHAYPVAGSQIAWSSFLFIPLMAISAHDSLQFAATRLKRHSTLALEMGCVALALFSAGRFSLNARLSYVKNSPLGLPGTEDIRIPADFASTLRVLSQNAAAYGDVLITLPGMFSFNNWTKVPTPTFNNATHWSSLLSVKQQQEIIDQLAGARRPVFICHLGLRDYLNDRQFRIQGPLYDYLQSKFERAFKLGSYEFWIRKQRTIVPLATADLLSLTTTIPGMAPSKIEIMATIPEGSRIARIELASLLGNQPILAYWDKNICPLYDAPIDLEGRSLAPKTSSRWGEPLPPLVRLDLPLEKVAPIHRPSSVLYLLDEHGNRIGEARFLD